MFFDLGFFVINYVFCYIPSRRIRMILYFLMSQGSISLRASVGFNVKILDIRGVTIKDFSNINSGVVLDGRGAHLTVEENVDVARDCHIWTSQHDVDTHKTLCSPVIIRKNSWLASRCTILPGVIVGDSCVVGSGSIVTKSTKPHGLYLGAPARRVRSLEREKIFVDPIRRFR